MVHPVSSPAQLISHHYHTGHIPQFLLEYGKHEFQWQDTYGPVYAIKGCFGASPRPANFLR
jgi:hypothetical protein